MPETPSECPRPQDSAETARRRGRPRRQIADQMRLILGGQSPIAAGRKRLGPKGAVESK